jgi:hypothetical protein
VFEPGWKVCEIEGSNETMMVAAHVFVKSLFDMLGRVDLPRDFVCGCRSQHRFKQPDVPRNGLKGKSRMYS